MSKRSREDTVEADVPRKQSKHDSGKSTPKEKSTTSANLDEKAAKAARKALKRAKRAQEDGASTAVNVIVDDSVIDEAATKAAKRAQKEAKKAQAATQETTAYELGRADDSSYTEHPNLVAKAQSEIDDYTNEQHITVTDPKDNLLRPIISFDYLPIHDKALKSSLAAYSAPTPIQAAAWPYLFARRDVIGIAETGSGKTVAFGLPCVRYISSLPGKQRKSDIKACIVSPTRELALQIHEQLVKIAEPAGLKVGCAYGGVNKDAQRESLKGIHIMVATPGRLNDFIDEGSIDLSHVCYLVLDEADRMLDTGFEEAVKKIASSTAKQGRQTLMFTATWPPAVEELASTFMTSPVKIAIGDNPTGELRANPRITQEVEVMDPSEKNYRILEILRKYQSGQNKTDRVLVFCLYKKEASRIEEFIRRQGIKVAGIHGDMTQQQRTASLDAFKKGSVPLLVATDVAARGLDIPAVKLVLNVTFPLTIADYVHRIGRYVWLLYPHYLIYTDISRTGRAGQTGNAITFFTDHEKGLAGGLINVLKAADQNVPENLLKYGTTVKKKEHEAYGAFYKDPATMKKATKITFD